MLLLLLLRREARRLEKQGKRHKGSSLVSAPLIIDPVHGPLVERLETECKNFENKFGIRVPVVLKAGQSVKRDAKAEPLREVGCQREECFPCQGAGEWTIRRVTVKETLLGT